MKSKKKISYILIIILVLTQIGPISGQVQASALTLTFPSDFKAEAYQNYIGLTWTDNNEVFSYTTIEKSTDQGYFSTIATVNKGTQTFKDYSVSNGHVYTYRARTYSGSVYSPYTREIEATYIYAANLVVSSVTSNQADLDWTYPVLVLSRPIPYETTIERRLSTEATWTSIATVPAGETHYRDSTVVADSTYYYRIRTKYPSSASPAVPNDTGLMAKTTYPLSTELSGYCITDTQIKLEWDTSLLNGGWVYLQKKDPAGNFYTIYYTNLEKSFIDTSVTKGLKYAYRLFVRSKNGTDSEFTQEIQITAEQVPAPSDLSVSAFPGKIILSWSYPFAVETGFEVWRKDSGFMQKIASLPKNSDSFSDNGVENGKVYTYEIRAMRGDTSFSPFIVSIPVNFTAPVEPKNPEYMASGNLLTIYDSNVVPSGTVYTLEYRESLNSEWKDYKSFTGDHLFAQMRFDPSTEFYFRVRANIGDLYTWGQTYHFFGTAPDPVQNLKAPISGSRRVILTWKDVTQKEDGFRIYRSVNGKTQLVGTVGADQESFTDKAPSYGNTSSYEVRPFNACGEAKSPSIKVTIAKIIPYKDIDNYKWASDAIYTLTGLGAFSIPKNGLFYPGSILSRGEFVHMLLKSLGVIYSKPYTFTLSDISRGNVYYEDMMAAVALGIVHPDPQGRVFPGQSVTRGDIAIMLTNALNCLGIALTPAALDVLDVYSDADSITPENASILASLIQDGIITGKMRQVLGLAAKATRAEATTIIYRAYMKYLD